MWTACATFSSASLARSCGICAALSLAVVAGLLWGCSDSPPEPSASPEIQESRTHSFELSIVDREVAHEEDTIRVTQGERVELRWTTDEATSIHLHGYDIEVSLKPNRPFTMAFDADASGRFPITSHGFEGRSESGPSHEHDEHEHGEHEHGDRAQQPSDGGEKTLLYFEVHPR